MRAAVVGLGVVVVAVPLLPVVVMVMMTMVTPAMVMVVVLLLLTGRVMLLPQLLLRLVMLVMHWRLRCGLLLLHRLIFNSQVTKESFLMWIVWGASFTLLIPNQQQFVIVSNVFNGINIVGKERSDRTCLAHP